MRLWMMDLADPTQPRVLGSAPAGRNAYMVAVDGSLATVGLYADRRTDGKFIEGRLELYDEKRSPDRRVQWDYPGQQVAPR